MTPLAARTTARRSRERFDRVCPVTARVVVVGAGLAGLLAASELLDAGVEDILVVDRAQGPGGLARTIHRDGYTLEPGAGTLMLPHPHLSRMLDRAGVEVIPAAPAASLRYVHTGDRLVALPASPKAMFAPLVPLTAKLRGMIEPFVRTPPESEDESLDSFLRRRLGEGLGGMLSWVAASGVFAGDPGRLSARAAFPALPALEDEAGSIVRGGLRRLRRRPRGRSRPVSHLPLGGMTELIDKLAAPLGDRFRTGFEVASVTRASAGWRIEGTEAIDAAQVVLAVSPAVAARMVDPDLGSVLSRSVSAPVVVAGLGGTSREMEIPPGFGVLTGPDARMATRGILFESSYAPGRAPEGHVLAKVIAGGAPRPEVASWDNDRFLEVVVDEMARVLGVEVAPSFTEIVRHYPGIPQYEVGHLRWLAELDGLLASRQGLHLTGWGYRGVGVAHLATDAVSVAERVAPS